MNRKQQKETQKIREQKGSSVRFSVKFINIQPNLSRKGKQGSEHSPVLQCWPSTHKSLDSSPNASEERGGNTISKVKITPDFEDG